MTVSWDKHSKKEQQLQGPEKRMSVSYSRSRMKVCDGERMSRGQGIKNDSLVQDPRNRVCVSC